MRCDTHCPQPAGFPWLAILLAAAAALALWGIGELIQAIGKPGMILGSLAAIAIVGTTVVAFTADAIGSTPHREKRPRYSELPTPAHETPAAPVELEPVTYPPLRAVPNHQEEAA